MTQQPDEPARDTVCPDCRCLLVDGDNYSSGNSSRYCDYCLLERVKDGEHVPMLPSLGEASDPGEAAQFRKERWFYFLCQRCGGTGEVLLTAWQADTRCFGCAGTGFDAVPAREVQRMQRWSATFQSNKEKEANNAAPKKRS